MTIMNQIEI